MKLIGINGRIGSGKNTVATLLKEKLNGKVVETSFAYKLKEMVAVMLNIPLEDTITQEGKNKIIPDLGKSVGEILQIVGTDAMRDNLDKDIWIKLLHRRLSSIDADYVIITDMRFPNEMNYIKGRGGDTIYVVRPDNPINDKSNRNIRHSSETSLNNHMMDYTVLNDKDLEHLEKQIDEIVKDI